MFNSTDFGKFVIDLGSHSIKIGLAGDDAPNLYINSFIAKPKFKTNNSFFLGKINDNDNSKFYDFSYPIERGIIKNYDDFEKFIEFAFNNINLEKYPILFCDSLIIPNYQRSKISEIMFEKYNIPNIYFENQTTLNTYSYGRCTSFSIIFGHGSTSTMALYESYSIISSESQIPFGGYDITKYIKNKNNFNNFYEAEKFKENKNLINPIDYYNLYFNFPKEIQLKYNYKNIVDLIYQNLMNCDIDTRKDFIRNIIIGGSSFKFTGFIEKLEKKLKKKFLDFKKLIYFPETSISSWIGGSILASLSLSEKLFVSKLNFQENGNLFKLKG